MDSALTVLHADDHLVAVAKPPGLPMIPARGEAPEESLHKRLERQLGRRLWVVHRLDRDASGLALFALTAEAHRELSLAFEHRRVAKRYLTLVLGRLEPPQGRIERALHEARRGKMRPAEPGEAGARPAVTDYAVQRVFALGAAAVGQVEARPQTGRQHQLRVHLRSAGAPILFDDVYGRATLQEPALSEAPARRLALHALALELPGPAGPLALACPLAPDLAELLGWLEGCAGVPAASA